MRMRVNAMKALVVALAVAGCVAHRTAPIAGQVPGGSTTAPAATVAATAPIDLAARWNAEHVSPPLPPLVRHDDIVRWLTQIAAQQKAAGDTPLFAMEEIGRSVEGRSINHVTLGHGPFHVLLWSQMHGDEPTATCALFDLFEYVRRHRAEPAVRQILEQLTLHVVPMLNPDGAERFQRRNAQGIDVNRDALLLQTPEGQALKTLRDKLNPSLGFNLHNQSWRTSPGKIPQPASISLLAVSFDPARSDNPGRIRAKKVCATIRDALEPLAPGRIARYDDEFEVRAFGDNITKWGTSVVLIETGGWPGEAPDAALVRLNFVALVSSLEALASGRIEQANPARYETLPMNDSAVFYRLIRGAQIVTGTGLAPFTGDIAFGISRTVTVVNGERQLRAVSRIEDLGDMRVFGGMDTIEANGLLVAPLFDPALKAGDEVRMPEWTSWKGNTISVGQPGDVVLLRPSGSGSFRVERVLRSVQ